MINVTKTYLPSLDEFTFQIKRAFENGWLTNRGPLVKELEDVLLNKLRLDHSNLLCLNNGTIPLQIAVKLLGNEGEIITTPFSYVATTSSIVWEKCIPIFVDIHPEYLTIDETKIEEAITEKTTCILATHVFGNPCDVDAIKKIAKKHNLKVIYDAAHCFGVEYKSKSIFEYGDVSTCSFHATKIFHTGEGGVIFCKDSNLFQKIFYSHNFGHLTETEFYGLGINAKMSEIHAALGLTIIKHIDDIFLKRKNVVSYYDKNLDFSKIRKIKIRELTNWNYSYYPLIFKNETQLNGVLKKLNDVQIFPRRYFYPSLNTLNYVDYKKCLISEEISSKILCLPLFVGIEEMDLKLICDIINQNI